MFAPAATPKAVIGRLYRSVAAVLNDPAMKDGLGKKMLTVTVSGSPEDFQKLVVRETHEWGDFLRQAKLKLQ
jgi:tripartite-type tricarboxylate transporter receptor subunit TctC